MSIDSDIGMDATPRLSAILRHERVLNDQSGSTTGETAWIVRRLETQVPEAVQSDAVLGIAACAIAALVYRYTGGNSVAVDDPTGCISFDVNNRANTYALLDQRVARPACSLRPSIAVRHRSMDDSSDDVVNREISICVSARSNQPAEFLLRFDPGKFSVASVEQVSCHYFSLLTQMMNHPDMPIGEIDMLAVEEAEKILKRWNATSERLPHDICLHEAFEAQAYKNPDGIAIISEGLNRTFSDIDSLANQLANHLCSLGVMPEIRVGICLDRSPDLLVAILAVMKCGGAYVPLDPAYPEARINRMIGGTATKFVVTNSEIFNELSLAGPKVRETVFIDRFWLDSAHEVSRNKPTVAVEPDSLCYVIHTSGSTGYPKPIAICHRGVLNNLSDLNGRFQVATGDAVLALSSPSFDMSVYEFLGVTLAGGTVVVPSPGDEHAPAAWVRLIRQHNITVWNSAPSLIELLLDYADLTALDDPFPIRLCMTGGDWVPATMPARFMKIAPRVRFVALGGATEASIHSTSFDFSASSELSTAYAPYGTPLANQRTYILDDNLLPVPVGVTGELFIGGVGLARGYLDCPQETAEKFIEWSHHSGISERLYRTGDLAKYWSDGVIEILGRKDFQVKLNGIRVELGEIESLLALHSNVKRAVVVQQHDSRGCMALVGYVTTVNGETIDSEILTARLRERVPHYMVPAEIRSVDSLPITANGKVDRVALQLSTDNRDELSGSRRVPAESAGWEGIVISAWSAVLGDHNVSAGDNFFQNGGDSMRAIKSIGRIDRRVKLRDIYRNPTPSELSKYLCEHIGPVEAREV